MGGLTPPLPAGKPELPRQPGSTAQYDAEAGPADAKLPTSDSPHSSVDADHFLHTLDWRGGSVGLAAPWGSPRRPLLLSHSRPAVFFAEDRDSTAGPEGHLAEEGPSAVAEDGCVSEPSDEEAPTPSAESGDTGDEDVPAPQAPGGPPSNADLLGCLLGAPGPAPEGAVGGLLDGDAALLFSSPAPAPRTQTTAPAGRCCCREFSVTQAPRAIVRRVLVSTNPHTWGPGAWGGLSQGGHLI